MKRSILIIITALTMFTWASSQNIDDALRYSRIFYNGSARFNAMGGAFTSLGADLSSINMNPAGVGMFRTFEMSFSPQLQYHNTTTTFNNTLSDGYYYNFGLSHAGLVWPVISNNSSNGLISLNFAYSYSNTNIFYENTTIEGVSENSSMADYWARVSEGTYYKDLKRGEGIAFDAWIIDTITGSGAKSYGTIFSAYGENTYSTYGQTQRRVISNYGYSGDHSFSIGGNVSDKFFFGTTFSISAIRYTGHYEHLEADYSNVITDFKNFTYIDHFDASGTGYSLKFGAVYKPADIMRIGVAIHTPTIYRLDEYFYDNIASHFDVNDNVSPAKNEPQRYSYTLTTPMRVLAGASVQLGKIGILSADYEYVNYNAARFSNASDSYNYSNENGSIQNSLKSTNNLRFGAEFRINSLYLRGGYGFYASAFKPGEVNQDLSYNTFSGGIGFRQQSFYIDLAYVNQSSYSKYFMYDDPPYLQAATIHSVKNLFTTTFGFRF
jgi:hypothetical protein